MRWIQINTSLLRLVSPGARYLIGVSGGRDSVALLHWLVECGYSKLIVCHLNHRLRGRASGADAIFVQKLAAKYDVALALGAIDVRALAVRTKQMILSKLSSLIFSAAPARADLAPCAQFPSVRSTM